MNNDERYCGILKDLLEYGIETYPRRQKTMELLGYSTSFEMGHPFIHNPVRKLNERFMYGEAHWILSGSNTVADISRHLARISDYSDNGYVFNGAYGPHFHRQKHYIVRALTLDQDTRQAVLTIWQERPESSKDIPCTVSLQWVIRGNKLHCIVNMRSSDAWLGLPYDLFNWSMMSLDIASRYYVHTGKLLDPGAILYNAGSCHLYDRDVDKATAASEQAPTLTQENMLKTVPWLSIARGQLTLMGWLEHKLEAYNAQE